MSQQFCLKWNNHMSNMNAVFKNLLADKAMVDVTVACDGMSLKAHKIVLAASSPFFQSLFVENPCKHPIVILKDIKFAELEAIIEFMYHGEVNVSHDQLSTFMKTAEILRIKGLVEETNEKQYDMDTSRKSKPSSDTLPASKRRKRRRKRSMSDHSDEASKPGIEQLDSDIEVLSEDMDASSLYSSGPSSVPIQNISSHGTNSINTQSREQIYQYEDQSFAQKEKTCMETNKLLKQTWTTDDIPRRSSRSSVQSSMEEDMRARNNADDSTSLVPTSIPSTSLVLTSRTSERSSDIKPKLFELDPPISSLTEPLHCTETLEMDPPVSPVAGPSHDVDENSMDQSSISQGEAGHNDNLALVSTESQPKGKYLLDFKGCSMCGSL